MKIQHVVLVGAVALGLWCVTETAEAQQVSFSFDQTLPLLDANYYAGVAGGGLPAASIGRGAFFASLSPSGNRAAFYAVGVDAGPVITTYLAVVDVGAPSSWRVVPGTLNVFGVDETPVWSPDGRFIFAETWRVDVETGAGVGVPFPVFENVAESGIDLVTQFYSFTIRPDDVTVAANVVPQSFYDTLDALAGGTVPELTGVGDQIGVGQATPDGQAEDTPLFTPRAVTRFPAGTVVRDIHLSVDGSQIAFSVITNEIPMESPDCGVVSDSRELYVLTGVNDLIASDLDAASIAVDAPTSLADPRIIPIRTGETGNYRALPFLSPDNQLVVYAEDFNDVFSFCDQADTFGIANFDIVLSNANGSDATVNIVTDGVNAVASGGDVHYPSAGNQFISSATQGGLRVGFNTSGAGFLLDEIFITNVSATTIVSGGGSDVSNTTLMVDTDGDGTVDGEITTGDNALQIDPGATEPLMVMDPSGTEVALPPGQVIEFPVGEPQSITIEPPIAPVTEAELPPDADVDAIPVVRDFGPDGTTFTPPIVITFAYSDAEIFGLDESTLRPFLFDENTQMFSIAVPEEDIVLRDPVNNLVQFKVSHFSTYGLGARGVPPAVPQLPWTWYATAVLLAIAGVGRIAVRARRS